MAGFYNTQRTTLPPFARPADPRLHPEFLPVRSTVRWEMQAAVARSSRRPWERRAGEPAGTRQSESPRAQECFFYLQFLAHNSTCSWGMQLLSQSSLRLFTIALGNLLLQPLPTPPQRSDPISLYHCHQHVREFHILVHTCMCSSVGIIFCTLLCLFL